MREVPLSMISELKLKLSVMFGRGTVFTRSEQYTPWGVCDIEGCSHDEDSTPREGGGDPVTETGVHTIRTVHFVTEKGVHTIRTVHPFGGVCL